MWFNFFNFGFYMGLMLIFLGGKMSYAILRVAKIKTGSGIKATQIHNLRERENKKY